MSARTRDIPARLPLARSDGEVRLHAAGLAEAPAPAADRSILRGDELARADRMVAAADRRRRVAAWAFLRHALSAHADVAPARWRFERDGRGRPSIAWPTGTGLDVSLAHCGDAVLVAVGHGVRVGVDLEDAGRDMDVGPLIRRCLTPVERRRDPGRRGFFAAWAAKEAYVKARGLGLAVPFDQVEIGDDGRVDDRSEHRDGLAWRCRTLRFDDRYAACLCVRADLPTRIDMA